jgi:hypothetical protein
VPELPVPIPSLPDRRWRPLTLDDVPAYTRLLEEARVADGGEEVDVDAESPTGALGVYEQVGFRPIRRSVRLQRPFVRGARTG